MKLTQNKKETKRLTNPKVLAETNKAITSASKFDGKLEISISLNDFNSDFIFSLKMTLEEAKTFQNSLNNSIENLEYYQQNGEWKNSPKAPKRFTD